MRSRSFGIGFLIALLCSLVAAVSPARAQVSNVTVQGTVRDPSGGAVPKATVTASNTQTGTQKQTTSDDEGRYTILSVPPGNYNVAAGAQGFSTTEERNQEFLVGTTVTIDFNLKLSSTSQTVEVSAQSGSVDTTQSQVATLVTPQTVDDLPTISRSFSDLAALSPGVLVATTSGTVNNGQAISVSGATAFQTGYIVDGTVTQNDRTSGSILNFAQDWIQEFSVISQMPTAEFGQASGGLINAVTRSGTNKFHGRVYEFLQNSALNSHPWRSATNPQANQYRTGGMLGGPIKQNKLFFFMGMEYYFNQQAVSVDLSKASASFINPALGIESGVFNITNRYLISIAKIDYTINSKNSLWLRWNYQGNSATNSGLAPNQPIGAASYTHAPQNIYAGAWDRTINATTFNEVRYNFNRNVLHSRENCVNLLGPYTGSTALYPDFAKYGGGDPIGYWAALNYPTIGGSYNLRCGSFAAGGTNAGGAEGVSEWHADEVFSKVSGSHTLKFGFSPHWYALNTYADYRNRADPAVQINGKSPFTFNPTSEVAPTLDVNQKIVLTTSTLPIQYAGSFQDLHKDYLQAYAYGFFAQDAWRTNNNLTLNMGIRWDFDRGNLALDKIAPPDHNHLNGMYRDVAPRLGFAWTPFSDKSTVIRGGVGIFYDKNTYNIYGAYKSDAAHAIQNFNLTASKATQNPYCFGNSSCAGTSGVPGIDQIYVDAELAYALNNYTIPAFPAVGNVQTILFGNGSTTNCTVTTPTATCVMVPAPTYTLGGVQNPAPIGVTYDIDPHYTIPGNIQASIGMARRVGNLGVSVDFNYLRGYDLLAVQDANVNPAVQFLNGQPDPTGNPNVNLPLNPRYTQILQWNSVGIAKDYSIRASANYHDHRGDTMTAAYSLGWAWDDNETQNGVGTGNAAANPFDIMTSWGPSSNDARNIINLTGTAKIPFGILLSPIFQFNSALPYTATTTTGTCPFYYSFCYPAGYSNNSLRGANTVMINARLSKVINFGESRSVSVFAEGYNLMNRSNFGTNFGAAVGSTTFGLPSNVSTAKRQFQFGARFNF